MDAYSFDPRNREVWDVNWRDTGTNSNLVAPKNFEDPNHYLIVNEIDGQIVSSCVCVIIPNLTRSVRPYAFVENVVTHAEHRRKGYAGECLTYAKKIAEQENCYKMMLLTGLKKPETLHFYEQAGYNSSDKTAFIQWIGMDK